MTTKTNPGQALAERFADFRNFLWFLWTKHLDLPVPTDIQYDIAHSLQHGPDRLIIEAFRGVGKSWITAAFTVWCLVQDPQLNIMVVSCDNDRAKDFTSFVYGMIYEIPELKYLKPKKHQRQSAQRFDVGPAMQDQSPSVKCVGITGRITGDRADLIVADDVEIPKNSDTEGKRELIFKNTAEFEAVLKPGGRVVFLGTPQCEQSLYPRLTSLVDADYQTRIWPARYPDEDREAWYGQRLGPIIKKALEKDPSLREKPAEPSRFPELELRKRRGRYGRSGFDLQFMLDTRLSDLHKYPLKVEDLVVMGLSSEKAPEEIIWAKNPDNHRKELPNVAMDGDYFYGPMWTAKDFVPYTHGLLVVDPSGRGLDETSYCVLKSVNGYVFLLELGGFQENGYSDSVCAKLVEAAKRHEVNKVLVEDNYGDGMFTQLLKPWFVREFPCSFEEIKVTGQKELRIIDSLEPVMNQHRLVVDPDVIEHDYRSVEVYPEETAHTYRLIHQMTRLTRERGCLTHDDRLDCLAIGVAHYAEQMKTDVQRQKEKREQEALAEELEEFMKAGDVAGRASGRNPRWSRTRQNGETPRRRRIRRL